MEWLDFQCLLLLFGLDDAFAPNFLREPKRFFAQKFDAKVEIIFLRNARARVLVISMLSYTSFL